MQSSDLDSIIADIEASRPVRDEDPYRQGIHAGIDRAVYRLKEWK